MFTRGALILNLTLFLWIPNLALAQSFDTAAAASPDTAAEVTRFKISDPMLPIDQLQIIVKPMTKAELQLQADAWFELLRMKAKQIAEARLGVKKVNGGTPTEAVADRDADATTQEADENAAVTEDVKQDLLQDVNTLQDERTALSDRLEVVLASLQRKGGDVEEYRLYIAAVSGIELDTTDVQTAWSGFVGWLVSKEGGQRWAWNLAKFVVILLVVSIIAKLIAKIVNWLLERKVKMSQLAENMISSSIKNIVFLIGFAVALTALEIDITPIIAAIGATGLVVGLALQGTLSNFASGLMILVNRPFDVGNVVTAGGITGTVDKMNLISTTFRTFDNQTIHVPNNEIWNNVITNITANENRRVDMEFGIGYDDDFEEAERIILGVVNQHDLVLEDPEPVVVTHALADSSVNIVCRPWAKTSDYWKVKTDVTRSVKRRFDESGISIPYPQTDIHLHQADSSSSKE